MFETRDTVSWQLLWICCRFFFRFNMIFKRTNFLNAVCNHRTPAISSKGVSRGAQPLESLEGCANHFRFQFSCSLQSFPQNRLGFLLDFWVEQKHHLRRFPPRRSWLEIHIQIQHHPFVPWRDSIWTDWRLSGISFSSGDFFDFLCIFLGNVVSFLLNSPGCPFTIFQLEAFRIFHSREGEFSLAACPSLYIVNAHPNPSAGGLKGMVMGFVFQPSSQAWFKLHAAPGVIWWHWNQGGKACAKSRRFEKRDRAELHRNRRLRESTYPARPASFWMDSWGWTNAHWEMRCKQYFFWKRHLLNVETGSWFTYSGSNNDFCHPCVWQNICHVFNKKERNAVRKG